MRIPVKLPYGVTAAYGEVNADHWKTYHKGIDLVTANEDRSIRAVCEGVVQVVAYDESGWGNYISVKPDYDDHTRHLYCHLDAVSVKVGKRVKAGERIGVMGDSGNANGVHLHFEVKEDGADVDPTVVLGICNARASNISTYTLDSTPDEYAIRAVSWARAYDVVRGDERGDLMLHGNITRQDMLVLLYRARHIAE